MPYLRLLSDPGMNYTLNRPLLDGNSPARLKEVSSIVPKVRDYDSWYSSWLALAKTAEKEKRYLDAPLRTTTARSFICLREMFVTVSMMISHVTGRSG